MKIICHRISYKHLLQACLPTHQNGVENRGITVAHNGHAANLKKLLQIYKGCCKFIKVAVNLKKAAANRSYHGFRRHFGDRQTGLKKQCLYGNPMSTNFHKTSLLKKFINWKLLALGKGF